MKYFIILGLLALFIFSDIFNFQKSKTKTLGESVDPLKNIRGVIVPHHDLADDLIISAINTIKEKNDYEKIIIIGPNHYYPESPTFMTTAVYQDYPLDTPLIEKLNEFNTDILFDRERMEKEHSIGIPIKYLREIFPQAEFCPLAISPHFNEVSLDKMAGLLKNNSSENTLYVLSEDFAHNLGGTEALQHNEESIKAISNFDIPKILSFDDKYLDSPVSTVLFLKIMKGYSAEKWTTLESTHGSIIVGEPDLNGTSYVSGVFSK